MGNTIAIKKEEETPIDHSLEKKEQETHIDHSLENIVAFSSANQAMGSVNEPEGLFEMGTNGKPIDRRTKINWQDPKYCATSFHMICQITSKLPTKVKAVGSGCMINHGQPTDIHDISKWEVLTCAHNVAIHTGLKEDLQFFNSPYCYHMRQGEKSWKTCFSIDEKTISVHPKHNGLANSGYDIAVCRQTKLFSPGKVQKKKKVVLDTVYSWAEPENLKKGMKIEITGYPGEKGGHPYTHGGEIVSVTKTRFGGHILWHNVDCTKGNSGSPIIITDKDWLIKTGRQHHHKVIIGIHTGQCLYAGFNYGTLITKHIYDWIAGKKLALSEQKVANEGEF